MNVEKSLLLLVNNNSSRRSIRKAGRLERAAKHRGFSVEVVRTGSADAATDLVSGDTSRFGVIGVVGGDGTIGPIAQELAKKKSADQVDSQVPLLAVFGGGSTNVLRKAIGMPRFGANKAIRAIEQGSAYDTNLMKVAVDERPETLAVSNLSIGASAEIFKGKRPLGRGGVFYALKLPGVIFRARHLDGDVTVSDQTGEQQRALHAGTDFFVHNGGPLGTFTLNPDKTYDSGYIETISVFGKSEKSPRFNALKALGIAVYDSFGKRFSRSEERIRGDVVEINLHQPAPLQIEGDYAGMAAHKITVTKLPDAVSVIAPDQVRFRRRGFGRSGQKIAWTTTL